MSVKTLENIAVNFFSFYLIVEKSPYAQRFWFGLVLMLLVWESFWYGTPPQFHALQDGFMYCRAGSIQFFFFFNTSLASNLKCREPSTMCSSRKALSILYLSKLREMVKDREAWLAAVHWVTKSQTRLSHWTTTFEHTRTFHLVSDNTAILRTKGEGRGKTQSWVLFSDPYHTVASAEWAKLLATISLLTEQRLPVHLSLNRLTQLSNSKWLCGTS